MATFNIFRHPVTILVTVFTKPDNLTNDLLNFSSSNYLLREASVNRKDLRALTLVGPPRDNPEIASYTTPRQPTMYVLLQRAELIIVPCHSSLSINVNCNSCSPFLEIRCLRYLCLIAK